MMRTIVAPPRMDDAPLADLKAWLSLTTRNEDALLTDLLDAATRLCEQFTGLVPLPTTFEEQVSPLRAHSTLVTRPVRQIVAIETVAPDGSRADASAMVETGLQADGTAWVRARGPIYGRLAVRIEAGAADSWATLDASLAQGIVRLAAHHYRMRDGDRDVMPTAVVALWRPHRRLRL